MEKQEIEQFKTIATFAIVGSIVVVIIYGGKKLTDFIGSIFGDDETDEEVKKASDNAEKLKYFDPAFIRNPPPGTMLLTVKSGRAKATNIKNAIGYIYDSPEKVKAQFSNLQTKSQVSVIAKYFKEMYGEDLKSYLDLKMDTDEQQKIWKDILNNLNSLPNYIAPNNNFNRPIANKAKAIIKPEVKKLSTSVKIYDKF